jgi:hypothetical protein
LPSVITVVVIAIEPEVTVLIKLVTITEVSLILTQSSVTLAYFIDLGTVVILKLQLGSEAKVMELSTIQEDCS